MSRYTTEQLQSMCKQFLEYKQEADHRCGFFLMFMSINTGYSESELMQRIRTMAETGDWT